MKPKFLLNLVLLVVLAALAGVAFFEPGKEEPKTVYLTHLDPESLDRFELKNQENMVFEKHEGHWRLTAPFLAPANDIRIRQMLNLAKAESAAHYPLKPEDSSKFELDKPKAVLNLGEVQLIFGGQEPIDMHRYVQVGDTLHLVSDDFFHHLIAKATDYVDKKLLPEDTKLKEIFLPGLQAKGGENGQWTMEPPGEVGAMNDLAAAWQSARAIEVKRDEQQGQGDVIRIGLNNGQSVEFVILQREPDLLLLRPDLKLQYLVAGESGKRLLGLQKPGTEADKEGKEDESESPADGSLDEVIDPEPEEDPVIEPE
ncbi:MAG: DUF4340 domain-containing protein [Methylococcaceae bacterium]|nr:DUF4340 domain-containing protein [Methylococcaceae bacterium]